MALYPIPPANKSGQATFSSNAILNTRFTRIKLSTLTLTAIARNSATRLLTCFRIGRQQRQTEEATLTDTVWHGLRLLFFSSTWFVLSRAQTRCDACADLFLSNITMDWGLLVARKWRRGSFRAWILIMQRKVDWYFWLCLWPANLSTKKKKKNLYSVYVRAKSPYNYLIV